MIQLRTVVCRNQACRGGGWWGRETPTRCPTCQHRLIELSRVMVVPLR